LKNPYVTDRPLTVHDFCIPREQALKQLIGMLENHASLVLLFGKPHIGKTSFLNQLSLYLGGSWHVHRIDWEEVCNQQHSGKSSPRQDAPLDILSRGVSLALDSPLENVATLSQIGAKLLSGKRYLVCLDGVPLETLENAAAWEQALSDVEAALKQISGLSLLIAIEGRPEECPLNITNWPLIALGGLTLHETEDLLMKPSQGVVSYDLDAARSIYQLTGGEPYLVQLFGQLLFEERASSGWVSQAEIDHAVDRVVESAAPAFQQLWERSTPKERVVLCVFSERLGSHGMATADDLRRHLERQGLTIPAEDIAEALERLWRREIVDRLGGGTFRFRSTLFLRWLRQHQHLLDAARQARYPRAPRRPTIMRQREPIDWISILLWLIAGVLVLAIAYVWGAREKRIVWTAPPSPASLTLAPSPSVPLPTPESGIIPGHLVYMARAQEKDNWAIYKMRADGSDPVRLTRTEANDTSPVWSPDGRRIAFVSDRDGNREIYVMNADGNEQINLTHNSAEDWTPTWSPDGRQIAFASFRDGNWELYVMNADGSEPQRLTRHPAADYAPSWSPDGRQLAFVSDRSGDLDIYVLDLESGQISRITEDPATDRSPTWSPDGRQLLWESYRDGNMEIYARELPDGELRNLSQDSYANDHGPTVSPWGRWIAFYTNRDGGWDIYLLKLETGERVNITMSKMLEQVPHWGR